MAQQDYLSEFDPAPPEEVNPLQAIWLEPRKAIRLIVWEDKSKLIYLLILATGLIGSLDGFALVVESQGLAIALGSIPANMIFSLLFTMFVGWLLTTSKGIFNGKATFQQVMYVQSWSTIPTLCASLISVLLGFLGAADADIMLFLLPILIYVAVIWNLVITIVMLSEVQGYPIGSAIMHMIMIIVGLVLVFSIITLMLIIIFGAGILPTLDQVFR